VHNRPWAVIAGSINIWDSSNGEVLVNYQGHNRNYGFSATLTPRQRLGFDLAYNFNDYKQNAFTCFNDSATSLRVVANAGGCTANGYDDPGNPLLTYGNYTNSTHYGMGSVMVKPIARITTELGYSITSVGGKHRSSTFCSRSVRFNTTTTSRWPKSTLIWVII
jgi:hypothetical protein